MLNIKCYPPAAGGGAAAVRENILTGGEFIADDKQLYYAVPALILTVNVVP